MPLNLDQPQRAACIRPLILANTRQTSDHYPRAWRRRTSVWRCTFLTGSANSTQELPHMRSVTVLALAAAAVTFPSRPVHAQDACGLVAIAQVTAAAGGPMHQAPGPVSTTGCAWGGDTDTPKRNVSISVRASSEYNTVKSRLGPMLVPVSAVGDSAFFFPTKHNNVVLYFLKGAHVYMVTVSVGSNTLDQNETAEKTLAGEMLAHL
jgi:hypothetical protein